MQILKHLNLENNTVTEKVVPDFNSVAFTGDYNDLINIPTPQTQQPLFSGDYNDLTNKPTLFDGNYLNLTNTPSLFNGDYNNLTNKPLIFDGDYNKLTNKPVVVAPRIETVSAVAHIISNANKENTIKLTNTGDVVITVAKDLAFNDLELVYFVNISARSVRFFPATGVVIRSEDGMLKMAKQNTIVALQKIGANEYLLTGNLIK